MKVSNCLCDHPGYHPHLQRPRDDKRIVRPFTSINPWPLCQHPRLPVGSGGLRRTAKFRIPSRGRRGKSLTPWYRHRFVRSTRRFTVTERRPTAPSTFPKTSPHPEPGRKPRVVRVGVGPIIRASTLIRASELAPISFGTCRVKCPVFAGRVWGCCPSPLDIPVGSDRGRSWTSNSCCSLLSRLLLTAFDTSETK